MCLNGGFNMTNTKWQVFLANSWQLHELSEPSWSNLLRKSQETIHSFSPGCWCHCLCATDGPVTSGDVDKEVDGTCENEHVAAVFFVQYMFWKMFIVCDLWIFVVMFLSFWVLVRWRCRTLLFSLAQVSEEGLWALWWLPEFRAKSLQHFLVLMCWCRRCFASCFISGNLRKPWSSFASLCKEGFLSQLGTVGVRT